MNTLSSLLNWIGNTIGANPSTLTTTSKTLVGAINEVGADYIVEQGTSGIWTYRKWNSGIAECWCPQQRVATAFVPSGSEGSVWFRVGDEISFPSSLFTAAPHATVWSGNGSSQLVWTSMRSVTSSVIQWLWVFDINTSVQPYYHIHAIGKWK